MTTLSPPRAPESSAVTIARRFQGPAGMGNGGYVAGLLGGAGPAKVILRRPVPVEQPLTVVTVNAGAALLDGADVLVEMRPGTVPHPLVQSADAATIEGLPDRAGIEEHPFPGCFVCGPLNRRGLRLAFKSVGDGVGAVFVPPPRAAGNVPAEYLVGALDCTSGWSTYVAGEAGVLGTIEYALVGAPAPGERLVVAGRAESVEGRKRRARSSLFGEDGRLLGSAEATWVDIALPDATAEGSRDDA